MMTLSRRVAAILLAASMSAAAGAAAEATCGGTPATCPSLVYRGLTYPYSRPPGSYLFIDGGVYPYAQATKDLLGDSTVLLPDHSTIAVSDLLHSLGLDRMAKETLKPVIGYGSNPSPKQLATKYAKQIDDGRSVVIPVMEGWIADYDVVWTPVFVSYGAMPATIASSPGTKADVWVTWLPESEVDIMNATEGVGSGLYALASLTGVDLAFDGPQPESVRVYISCAGALTLDGKTYAVSGVHARNRRFEPIDSPEALRLILPTIGWTGSVIDLLYANVSDPDGRAARNKKLRALGKFAADPHASGMQSCGAGAGGQEKPQ